MKTPQHTPTPWKVADMRKTHEKGELVISGGLMKIASFPSNKEGEANAAFIVRAVNSHESLIAFINACLDCKTANELEDFVSNNAENAIAKSEKI